MKQNEGIVVVSAFDGITCAYMALKKAGIKVYKYFAYEIDKFAIKQTNHNFPEVIQLGDIKNSSIIDFQGLKIDLFCGGSPCQGFSFAGNQLAFDDPRSKLFFEYVRLWNEIKKENHDAFFFLENVNMKKNELRIISEYMGVLPVNLNSNLISAQNRNRWYWSNIKTQKVGLFSELYTNIPSPADKKIYIKDILQPENEIEGKYYIETNKHVSGLDINRKAPCQRSATGQSLDKKHNYNVIKLDKKLNKKNKQDKASCLTCGGNSGGNHSDMDILCINPKNNDGRQTYQQDRIYEVKGKSPAICASLVNLKIIQKGHGFNKGGEFIDKSPTLTTSSWEHNNHLQHKQIIRRFTVRECSRLQTIPENYEWVVSNSQAYKMLGNGWTVDMIAHAFSFLPNQFKSKIKN